MKKKDKHLNKRIAIRLMQGKSYKQTSRELGISIDELKLRISQRKFKFPKEPETMKRRRIYKSMLYFERPEKSAATYRGAAPIPNIKIATAL